jgi:hypothetical protein
VAQRLQRGGLAEHGVLMVGREFQHALKSAQRGLGVLLAHVADGQTQVGFQIGGVERAGVLKPFGRLVPDPGALQADCQIEPPQGVAGLQARQGAVTLSGRVEPAQFELDMRQRTPNLGRCLIPGDGPLQ